MSLYILLIMHTDDIQHADKVSEILKLYSGYLIISLTPEVTKR